MVSKNLYYCVWQCVGKTRQSQSLKCVHLNELILIFKKSNDIMKMKRLDDVSLIMSLKVISNYVVCLSGSNAIILGLGNTPVLELHERSQFITVITLYRHQSGYHTT